MLSAFGLLSYFSGGDRDGCSCTTTKFDRYRQLSALATQAHMLVIFHVVLNFPHQLYSFLN